jgi:hypothetical protein
MQLDNRRRRRCRADECRCENVHANVGQEKYKEDWPVVTVRHDTLKHSVSIVRATRRSVTWTEDEENKLRHAVRLVVIATLVPVRTKRQCTNG